MKLVVNFVNGSVCNLDCRDMTEAYESANRVSTSGGKVRRIEILTGESLRALWDISWDEKSQLEGLRMPR